MIGPGGGASPQTMSAIDGLVQLVTQPEKVKEQLELLRQAKEAAEAATAAAANEHRLVDEARAELEQRLAEYDKRGCQLETAGVLHEQIIVEQEQQRADLAELEAALGRKEAQLAGDTAGLRTRIKQIDRQTDEMAEREKALKQLQLDARLEREKAAKDREAAAEELVAAKDLRQRLATALAALEGTSNG